MPFVWANCRKEPCFHAHRCFELGEVSNMLRAGSSSHARTTYSPFYLPTVVTTMRKQHVVGCGCVCVGEKSLFFPPCWRCRCWLALFRMSTACRHGKHLVPQHRAKFPAERPACLCPKTLLRPDRCPPLDSHTVRASPGSFSLVAALEGKVSLYVAAHY